MTCVSRSLVLAIIAALLVASCVRAEPLSPMLSPMVKHGHPDCATAEFNTSATMLFGICLTVATNVGELLQRRDLTPALLTTEFETACDTPCAQSMLSFPSNYHKCIVDDVLTVSVALTHGCERDPVSNARCIVDVTLQMASHMMCEYNMTTYRPVGETSCKLMPQCRWEGDSHQCKFNVRTEIPRFCNSFCAQKFMENDLSPFLKMQFDEKCLKVDDQYCEVLQLRSDMFDDDEQSTMMMCSSPVQFECSKRASQLHAAKRLYDSVKGIPSCLVNRAVGRADPTPTDLDMMMCTISIPYLVHAENTATSTFEHRCARNAEGKLCSAVVKEVARRRENDRCLQMDAGDIYDTSCANCHANISNFIHDLGCCAGNLSSGDGSKMGPRVEIDRVLMRFMTSDPLGEFVVKPTVGGASGSTIYISGLGSFSLGSFSLGSFSLGSFSLGSFSLGSGFGGGGGGDSSIPSNAPPRPTSDCYTTGCKMYWNGREYVSMNRYDNFRAFDECTGVDMQATMMQSCAAPTITPISTCFSETFIANLEDAQVKCDSALMGMSEDLSQLTAAMFNSFCSSACLTAVELVSQSPHCIGSEMLESINMMKVMCTKDDSNQYCGLHLNVMDRSKCSHYTSTACNADANCGWKTESPYYCEQKPTDAFLATACTVCLSRFAQASQGSSSTTFQNIMCAKEGSTFCFNPVMNTLNSMKDGVSSTVLEPMCASSTDKTCFRKVVGAITGDEMKGKMNRVKRCMEDNSHGPRDSAYTVERKLRDTKQCIDNSGIKETKGMMAMARNICNKNAAGALCLPMMKQYENNTCFRTLGQQHTCSEACSIELQTVANDIGCCMGTLQEAFAPVLTQDDLPRTPGVNNTFAFPVMRQNKTAVPVGAGERFIPHVGDGVLGSFGMCDSLNTTIDRTLHVGCGVTLSAKIVKRSITIPASFNRINRNPELKRNVLAAMVKDVATTLGVPEDYILNPKIVEDKSRYVSVSSSRRMTTLAAETAAKLEFDLQSESDADTTTYSENFDTLYASHEIQLTQTEVVLEVQCTDCTAEGATTLNSDVYVAPDNAESGATLSSVIVVIMVTFIAVMSAL